MRKAGEFKTMWVRKRRTVRVVISVLVIHLLTKSLQARTRTTHPVQFDSFVTAQSNYSLCRAGTRSYFGSHRHGEVLSWGLNRFAQLGYVVETNSTASIGRIEEPIQSMPKKIVGQLKKECVRGVAASKTSSACWTATEVFTWGTIMGN